MNAVQFIITVNVIVLFANAYLIIFSKSSALEILSRLPTAWGALIGSLIGLLGVAWTAKKGFSNLIAAQEHRAVIEARARSHQYDLDEAKYKRDTKDKAIIVASALNAELASLLTTVHHQQTITNFQVKILRTAKNHGSSFTTKMNTHRWHTPIWDEFTRDVGLLGVSLAADVVTVYSQFALNRNSDAEDVEVDFAIILYEGMEEHYKNLSNDIIFVGRRLSAMIYGKEDPGILYMSSHRREKRIKELGQDAVNEMESGLKI